MNSQETEIRYAPLTQGAVVAALYNADSRVPISAEYAETRVREKLGTAIGIDGGRVVNYEGLIDAADKVRIDVYFKDKERLRVRPDRYDTVKRIIDAEIKKFCAKHVSAEAVEVAKSWLTRILIFLCVISSLNAFALTEVVDGVEWTFEENGEEVLLRNNINGVYDLEYVDGISTCNLRSVIDNSISYSILKIPSVLNGKPVTAIGALAFAGCQIENLIIPSSVRQVSGAAFQTLAFAPNYSSEYTFRPWGLSVPKNILFEGDFPSTIRADDSFRCKGTKYTPYNSQQNRRYDIISSSYNDGYSDSMSSATVWVYSESNVTTYTTSPLWPGYRFFWRAQIKVLPSVVAEPGDMTVIRDSVSVTLQSSSANIYYTMDGSNPLPEVSERCFKYSSPIVVAETCTIKAIAVVDCPFFKTCTFAYARGMVDAPLVTMANGTVFDESNSSVEIASTIEGVVIRYSIDGSAVTEKSPIYTGPFMISETTTVRAKAFKEDWFDSEEAVQTFTRVWYTNETPVISAESGAFDAASQEVMISCATEGATVYYTIDGSEPSAANGRVYKGPFRIYDSVTVKAIAVKDDWKDSAVASAAFTKNNGLSAAINMFDCLPETDATYPWTVVSDVTHDGVSAVRSGAIGANGLTYLQLTVRGAGRLSFWWKTTCEPMWDGAYYDYASFKVGGVLRACLAGTTEWRQVVMDITTTGKHVLRWEYQKDDADSIPPDCVWLDQVQWVPADDSGHTLTTETPVPYSWLERYGFGVETDFETAAKMRLGKVDGAGRAMSVEDDYVAGTDPTNLTSKLTATIKMGADGNPIVSWKPSLNGEDADGAGIREGVRSYSVYGKQTLDDAAEEWKPVAEGDEGNYRFFKVKVEVPE